ncbi:hypothetical protein XU18_3387 [Perkinsela sp. CCAP 1560/4]|nr:hypothetical protein XU18_3387 [Perkinsela sp. CCAP 1560/4]|eukprot:KNH05616.1 hypothetical protein XU18_3387 [Perkinsela sp. CCAP 1560/4]
MAFHSVDPSPQRLDYASLSQQALMEMFLRELLKRDSTTFVEVEIPQKTSPNGGVVTSSLLNRWMTISLWWINTCIAGRFWRCKILLCDPPIGGNWRIRTSTNAVEKHGIKLARKNSARNAEHVHVCLKRHMQTERDDSTKMHFKKSSGLDVLCRSNPTEYQKCCFRRKHV